MKIYTKTGDAGETGLFGGLRVGKDDARVAAYGDVDELNAALGEARTRCADAEIDRLLAEAQEHLFCAGAELATPAEVRVRPSVPVVEPSWTAALEESMDRWEAELEPLRHFVLPGGTPLASALHLARAVCRRAERRVVALRRHAEVRDALLAYLNRLSDFLFVASRVANHRAGVKESPWMHRPPSP